MAVHKKDSTKDLGSLLQTVFQQKNWKNCIGQHQVFLFWDKLVGELSSHAQPNIIRDDILWVSVSDSVWMQQLQFEKQTLLDQINAKLIFQHKKSSSSKSMGDAPIIKDLKFKFEPNLSVTPKNTPVLKPSPTPIDQSRYEAFKATISSINDESVKESLKSLWLKLEGRKKE